MKGLIHYDKSSPSYYHMTLTLIMFDFVTWSILFDDYNYKLYNNCAVFDNFVAPTWCYDVWRITWCNIMVSKSCTNEKLVLGWRVVNDSTTVTLSEISYFIPISTLAVGNVGLMLKISCRLLDFWPRYDIICSCCDFCEKKGKVRTNFSLRIN